MPPLAHAHHGQIHVMIQDMVADGAVADMLDVTTLAYVAIDACIYNATI